MKIVHLCTMDHGGAGNAAYRLHRGLLKIGVDSKMVVALKNTTDPSVIKINPTEEFYKNNNNFSWEVVDKEWKNLLNDYPNHNKDLEIFSNNKSYFDLTEIKEVQDADILNLHWVAGLIDYKKV